MSLPKSSAIFFFLSGIKKGGHIPAWWVSPKNYTWLCLRSASALDARKCHSSTRWLGLLRGRSSSGAEMRERWHTSERGSLWPDEPPGDDWAAAWACGFRMLETDQAAGILGFIGWWTLAWQQSCLRPIIAPGATGRGSQPSNASPQLPRFLKMWPRTGSRSRPSGKSTSRLPEKSHAQSLMSVCQTRSTRRTCCFFPMTAFPGAKRCTNMLSQSSMLPATSRRLSLLLARPQQRSPMPCLASTNGGLWSCPSFSRLTLDANLWVRQASFWQNMGFLLGVVVWTFTGTRASWNASTAPWLNGYSGISRHKNLCWCTWDPRDRVCGRGSGWKGSVRSLPPWMVRWQGWLASGLEMRLSKNRCRKIPLQWFQVAWWV